MDGSIQYLTLPACISMGWSINGKCLGSMGERNPMRGPALIERGPPGGKGNLAEALPLQGHRFSRCTVRKSGAMLSVVL